MLCPLQTAATYADPDGARPVGCDDEECAWWDARTKRCAVLMLAMRADDIQSVLRALAIQLQGMLDQLLIAELESKANQAKVAD